MRKNVDLQGKGVVVLTKSFSRRQCKGRGSLRFGISRTWPPNAPTQLTFLGALRGVCVATRENHVYNAFAQRTPVSAPNDACCTG